ncbi:VWFA domain-containing protein [Meloidogyne graminicola]|uniref:VWFA domain-containing protein n=1 Tax=Meloidogyne graminicola TaxID=189291 RepID=A0A8S9ZGV8_9BILA|nr:VWFA domain-containing protein [Meloidogyne graminicola]
MVYSPELGYDPDEWEECSEDKELPVFVLFGLSMFSRACIGIGTIILAALFFWYIEANKRRNNGEKNEIEEIKNKLKRKISEEEEEEDFSAETILEMASKEAGQKIRSERKGSSKRKLSAEEINELMAWKAEVHRLEQERLRAASEEPIKLSQQINEDNNGSIDEQQQSLAPLITIASTSTETATTVLENPKQIHSPSTTSIPFISHSSIIEEQQQEEWKKDNNLLNKEFNNSNLLIKQKDIPIYQIQPQVEIKSIPLMWDLPEEETPSTAFDQLQIKSSEFINGAPGKTPTSTPQDGVPVIQKLPELAAHYRRMADQLTQKLLTELDEIGKGSYDPATVTAVLQDKHKDDINEGLAETGAPKDIQKHLARQLDSHVASIVVRELRRRSSTTALLQIKQQELLNKFKENEKEEEEIILTKKSSSSSEDTGFVKIGLPEDDIVPSPTPPIVIISPEPPPQQLSTQKQQQQYLLLQPLSSQQGSGAGSTDEEEEEEFDDGKDHQNIRISLFSNFGDGDGMSTTADDIEFVSSKSQKIQQTTTTTVKKTNIQQNEENQHHPLNVEEAKQVAALLQEYEITPSRIIINNEEIDLQKQNPENVLKTSNVDETSLPGSAKQTPGGSFSIPESPESLGFDIISFPQSPAEMEAATTDDTVIVQNTELNLNIEQKQQLNQNQEQQKLATVVFPAIQSQFSTTVNLPSSSFSQNKQTAEALLQEAIDYMQQQENRLPQLRNQQQQKRISLRQSGEFVMEEEMLESEEIAAGPPVIIHSKQKGTPFLERKLTKEQLQQVENNVVIGGLSPSSPQGLLAESAGGEGSTPGADGTSRQIATNEVFDKPDALLLFDDADDRDVTYAPEIQSMEIPPDQLSQADSLNLVDENFSEQPELGMSTSSLKRQMSEPQPEQIPPPKPPRTSLHFEENEMAEILKQQKVEESPNLLEQTEVKNVEPNIKENQILLPPHPSEHQQQRIIFPDQKQNPQAPQFLLRSFNTTDDSTSSLDTTVTSLRFFSVRQSSLLSVVGVTSTQEMLLKLQSLEALSEAMRKAGLESSNLIFGIDYTASNKYQGEKSFCGRSLHCVDEPGIENPYQQVIKIMGRTLAPFASSEHGIPAFGFGDVSTGDWSVFSLNKTPEGECKDLDDVLRIYNQVTPNVDLSGPTNFAPLIYRSMEICYARKDYHILVIIADGQVTNEKATRKAIVAACQYPLSIIVVGVGDGPWDMMKLFDESLPKRPWDNFHFVEFSSLFTDENIQPSSSKELAFAINSLLEIPDQVKINYLNIFFYLVQHCMQIRNASTKLLLHSCPSSFSPFSFSENFISCAKTTSTNLIKKIFDTNIIKLFVMYMLNKSKIMFVSKNRFPSKIILKK